MQYELIVGTASTKSRFGMRKVGTAEIDFGTLAVTIDGKTLPAASLEHVVKYGLDQYISDGAACNKTDGKEVWESGMDARVDKLLSGDFTRGKGEAGPIDNVETLAKKLARDEIATAFAQEENKAAKAAFKAKTKEEQAKAKEDHFTANAERFLAEAKRQIDDRKKSAGKVDLTALGLTA